jgi:hypothetical protein
MPPIRENCERRIVADQPGQALFSESVDCNVRNLALSKGRNVTFLADRVGEVADPVAESFEASCL